jgi:1-acyl-sn-glycerol-3-phosphate acyltransferase
VALPLRWARAAYEYFWFCLGYAYFGILGLLLTLASALLYPLLPRQRGARLGRSAIGVVFRSFLGILRASGVLKVDLSALDTLRYEPGVIIAPNHPCLLDAVFVISRVPSTGCIMKAQIWDNVVLGGGARLAGYIRNDSPRSMVRQAARELRAGHPLLVFPEGTRTRSGPVNEFRGGFALVAKRAGAPVQTVFIETDNPFLSKGWPLFKRPRFPLVYRVRLGERFRVTGDVKSFLRGLEDYYRRELGPPAPPPERPRSTPEPAGLIAD